MSKRRSQFQITKDNNDEEDDQVELNVASSRASDEVMAKRKIIQPKFRNSGNNGQAQSSNPFQFQKLPASSSSTPSSSFNTIGTFSPATKPNLSFGSNGVSVSSGFKFGNSTSPVTTTTPSTSNVLTKVSPDSSSTSTEDLKKYKFKALNCNFVKKISDLVLSNSYGDLTVTVEKYIAYAKQINSDSSAPSAAAATPSAQPVFNITTSLDSTSKASLNGANKSAVEPASTDRNLFSFSNAATPAVSQNTVTPTTSLFSSAPKQGDAASKEQAKSLDTKPATTTFSFSSKPESADQKPATLESNAAEPKLSFGSSSNKLFNFGSANTKPAESASSEEKPANGGFKFGNTSTDSTKPSTGGFKFGTTTSTESTTQPSTGGFKFGTTTSTDSTTQPSIGSFKFGTTTSTDSTIQPSIGGFKFGTTTSTDSTTQPSTGGFKFGNITPSTNETKPAGTTNLFGTSSTPSTNLFGSAATTPSSTLFGNNASSNTASSGKPLFGSSTSSFSFGKPASTDSPKPSFSFGAATPAASSFSSATPSSTPATSQSADEENGDSVEEAGATTDFTEKGPGEEHENSLYEKKAKVYEIQDNKPVSLGVGVLRVLKHRETGKSRVVVRAEGGGRVLLNTLLRDSLSYGANSSTVSVVDVLAGGGFKRYMLRVKTADDAADLSKVMEDNKA